MFWPPDKRGQLRARRIAFCCTVAAKSMVARRALVVRLASYRGGAAQATVDRKHAQLAPRDPAAPHLRHR